MLASRTGASPLARLHVPDGTGADRADRVGRAAIQCAAIQCAASIQCADIHSDDGTDQPEIEHLRGPQGAPVNLAATGVWLAPARNLNWVAARFVYR